MYTLIYHSTKENSRRTHVFLSEFHVNLKHDHFFLSEFHSLSVIVMSLLSSSDHSQKPNPNGLSLSSLSIDLASISSP